jgi:hypothetical protein
MRFKMSGGYVLENGDFVPDTTQESNAAPLPVDSVCGAAETTIIPDTTQPVDSTGG